MTTSLSHASVSHAPRLALRRVARTFLGGVLFLALSCRGDSADRSRALEGETAKRLVGVWDATFWLDQPVTLTTAPSTLPRRLVGSMAFIEDNYGTLSPQELSDPTHVGVYDIDFRAFGFQLGDPNAAPVAVARTSVGGRDSVLIVLAPGTSQYPLRVTGAFTADSITGVWTAGQALGGGGRFSLRRHRTGA